MIQNQLVDYISAQLKLGISRDAVKSALVGVGWTVLDVEDTLKKVESAAPVVAVASSAQVVSVQPQRQPFTVAASAVAATPATTSFPKTSVSPTAAGMGGVKNPEPQMIRMSDLVSSSAATPAAVSTSSMGMGAGQKNNSTGQNVAKATPTFQGAQFVQKPSRNLNMVAVILSVLVVLLAGFSGYLLFKNNSLNATISSGTSTSQGSSDQLTALQAQLQALNASTTALTATVTSMTAQNQDLLNNLALAAVVPSLAPTGGATSSPITLSGVLSLGVGKSALYTLTTSYGAKAYVKNSADASVKAALQPLIGAGATVQLSGTFVPGSPNITITTVNGNPIMAAAPAMTTSPAATTTKQ